MIVTMAMRLLAPTGDVPALAAAIVAEARTWDEVTWAVGVAFREGSNRLGVVGDQGRYFPTFKREFLKSNISLPCSFKAPTALFFNSLFTKVTASLTLINSIGESIFCLSFNARNSVSLSANTP
jgi:hypothetical protein